MWSKTYSRYSLYELLTSHRMMQFDIKSKRGGKMQLETEKTHADFAAGLWFLPNTVFVPTFQIQYLRLISVNTIWMMVFVIVHPFIIFFIYFF
jgi:hypothetical protein